MNNSEFLVKSGGEVTGVERYEVVFSERREAQH